MRDPYEVLGVSRDADQAEIKASFRRLAARFHPDKNPNDATAPDRFKEVNAAYQILSDEQRRRAYDRFGSAAFQAGADGFGDVDLGSLGLDGLFGDILGAFGIRTGDRGDLRKRVRITFEEAVLGTTTQLSYERTDTCDACSGLGAEPGSRVDRCAACGGRGKVRFQQGVLPIAVERACSTCRGSGKIPTVSCTKCLGRGLIHSNRTLEIMLPAGIEPGSTRLVEGAGNRTRPDRPAGDLEIVVEVAEHPFFRREGSDIVCSVPISFVQASLGGEVDVPSLQGKLKMRVPPSTQPGTVLRIKGKGAPQRVGGRGDQLVEVRVEVPTTLSPRARELLGELGKELGEDVQPQQRTFVEKLKGLFG